MITLVGKSGKAAELPDVSAMPNRLNGIAIIESISRPELQRLASKYNLSYRTLEESLDINETPNLTQRDGYHYLYVSLPNARANQKVNPITRPVLVVYNNHLLLIITSMHLSPVLPLTSLVSNLALARTVQSALVYLLTRVVESYDRYIKTHSNAISSVVAEIQTRRLENEVFLNLILLEDQINDFVSALTPLAPLLQRIQADRSIPLSGSNSDDITDAILATQQYIGICNSNARRITSIRDAYSTMTNNSLNSIMKTLTVATMLIAIPDLVFSFYGMNVHVPMQEARNSFLIVTAIAVVATIVVIIWAKKRHLL